MEIKTAEQILREVLIEENIVHGEDYIDDYSGIWAAQIAMVRFAQQFIDLAAEKADVEFEDNEEIFEYGESKGYFRNPIVKKQSILDIKQLIK